ncbi:hypothetical protein IFM89_019421 [Coptis chinensis]|uniref:Uncharacterized protein n=1 Tax=Coptis chinensis TaxID=261450 RepID=A0A835ILU9_9MAGN|nr:hypothetical protein IFM89_019421 [Coptis chinensis]
MTTPDVFEVLHSGRFKEYPSSVLGVGTVLNDMDAKSAIKAGARFLMSPAMVKDILDDIGEVLYIPGVMTPTEVLNAHNAGAQVVKVYPVSVLGGVQYITALKKSFSHIPMVASQGIMLDSIGAYIHEGASEVLLSDAIFKKDAMRKRNYGRIHELACRAKTTRQRNQMEESDDNTLTRKGFSLQIHGGIEND